MQSYIYILASDQNGTLYIGVTANLIQRIYQHKNDLVKGFSNKYQVHKLVYYKVSESIESAFMREKQLKRWKREWKLRLIEGQYPTWKDLYESLL